MGNTLVIHGNLSATKDVSWYLHSHSLPCDKPDFADQAFVYLDLYFVQSHNWRSQVWEPVPLSTNHRLKPSVPRPSKYSLNSLESREVGEWAGFWGQQTQPLKNVVAQVILLRVVPQQPWLRGQHAASFSLGLADSDKEKCFLQQCGETT